MKVSFILFAANIREVPFRAEHYNAIQRTYFMRLRSNHSVFFPPANAIMKIVLQRVSTATVKINGANAGSIGKGILLLFGVHAADTEKEADFLADKCIELRIFPDENGKMNRSLIDISGAAMVVSQFTLLANCSKGRRPSFIDAAPPEKGDALYRYFIARLKKRVINVQSGIFGAMMQVELINDGPVTLILER